MPGGSLVTRPGEPALCLHERGSAYWNADL